MLPEVIIPFSRENAGNCHLDPILPLLNAHKWLEGAVPRVEVGARLIARRAECKWEEEGPSDRDRKAIE